MYSEHINEAINLVREKTAKWFMESCEPTLVNQSLPKKELESINSSLKLAYWRNTRDNECVFELVND